MGGNRSRDHPQNVQQRRTIPQSRPLAVPAPFTQGSLWGRGMRIAASARWASSQWQWFSVIPRSEATWGSAPFYDGRGFGPPRSSAPTEGLPKSQQQVDVGIGPYGKPNQPPKPAAHSGAFAPRTRGMGGNRRKDHPKRGSPPRPPRQRLAKRKARKEQLVKFSLCPIPSECSTAYRVRKFAKGPARVLVGAALIGQNGLEPRPAAREGAPRP